jgi:serine phosphatase RsbU (regulator of sigma subunit)
MLFVLGVMITVYLYFSHHERTVLSNEIQLRGQAICTSIITSAEDLLVMKDDLGLAKIVYDTKESNEGVIYCYIIDNERFIWAHTDVSLVNTTLRAPQGMELLKNNPLLVQPYRTAQGIDVFDIAMPITVGTVKIGEAHVALSIQTIKDAVAEARKGIAVVTIIIIVLGVAGVLVLVSFIIGSLGEITNDIAAIGDGDLDRKIVTSRTDEIGRIARTVQTMTVKLKQARQDLVEKERMKKEMQIANEIQTSLLPQALPQIPQYDIAAYYQSAMEVGGDYYDFITIDKDRFAVIIADVSGKGIAGSLVMTMVRSLIRLLCTKILSPQKLLVTLNSALSQDIPEGMFITLFYVLFDLSTEDIRYCCCGHNPPYFYAPQENALLTLKPDGPPLGTKLFDRDEFDKRLKEETKSFSRDTVLVLYTDGITEAMDENKELFGEERLEKLLKNHHEASPHQLKDIIKKEIEAFTGGAPQADDITFVIIKRQ